MGKRLEVICGAREVGPTFSGPGGRVMGPHQELLSQHRLVLTCSIFWNPCLLTNGSDT